MDTNTKLLAVSKKFAAAVKKKFGVNLVSVVLFGSVARKEANPNSDIDLLLVFNDLPDGRLARTRLLDSVEEKLERELKRLREDGVYTNFNYLMKTREEAMRPRPLYLDMTMEAVYLYDEGKFFRGIIDNFKRRLKKLGSVRKKVGSVRYWDIKPDYKVGEVFEI